MKHKQLNILLIENNPGDARLIREMLPEGKGAIHSLEWVESLTAGLQRIARGGIDLVLLDLGLPESTGLETLRRLRANAGQSLVVVVMSGLGDEDIAAQAVLEGAQDYLIKGQVDAGLLNRSIRYALERNEAAAALRCAHDELENQVAQRTAALANTIESLQREITERKRVEEALQQSEEKFSAAFHASPNLMSITRVSDATILEVNEGYERLLGYSRAESVGRTTAELSIWADPADRDTFIAALQENGEINDFETMLRRKDGTLVVVIDSARKFNIQGEDCVLSVVHDISERKRAEEALLVNEERYRMAQALGHVGSWEYNIRTNMFWGSDEAKRIYGFDLAQTDFSIDEVERCIPERERVHQAMIDLVERGKSYDLEFEIHPVNSPEPRIITSIAELKRDVLGNPLRVMGVIHDITGRKRVEEELKFQNILLVTEQESSVDAILVVDEQGKMINFNKRFTEIWGIPQDVMDTHSDELALHHVYDKLVDPEEFLARVEYLYKHKDEKSGEEILFKDGRVIDRYSAPMIGVDGKNFGRVWYFRDITERKNIINQLHKSIEEKEILLKELYHRTKNNMQVICSLLDLKINQFNDESFKRICSEIITKIQTMALVHQKLYESNDLSNINLSEYVSSIADIIMKNYLLTLGKISIHQSVDSIPISIDTAMPFGLIINELITNSIKYAFPGDRKGDIWIEAHCNGDEITVEYRDNGIGLPYGFDPDSTSTLGMRIIQGIAIRQLGGDIKISSDKGFKCQIIIKTNLYRKRV